MNTTLPTDPNPTRVQELTFIIPEAFSAELCKEVLCTALQVDWSSPECHLALQRDKRRLRYYLEPAGNKASSDRLPCGLQLAARCRIELARVLPDLVSIPSYADVFHRPSILITLPGAKEQKFHRDADDTSTYSLLVAVTPRDFIFKDHGLVQLRRRDVLVFKAFVCHAGS